MIYYITKINIPAYDANKNGIIVKFKLMANLSSSLLINASGNIAIALQNNFKRTIEIMSSLKKCWQSLEYATYHLECSHDQFSVKDSKSSSMALSIALINCYRAMNAMPQITDITGTGILRIDGSFENSHLEDKKYLAAKKEVKTLNKFITPYECKHLFDLEKLIYEY